MKRLDYDDIGMLFKFEKGKYKILIAYESACADAEERTIFITPKRKFKIHITPGTDILLIVYCIGGTMYTSKVIDFDESGVAKLAPILDDMGIKRVPESAERWNLWKRIHINGGKIILGERGFYTIDHYWLDCDVYKVWAFTLNGVVIDGKQLQCIYYEKAFKKIEDAFYEFLNKIIGSESYSIEEYKTFKERYIHSTFGTKAKCYYKTI